MNPGIGVLEPRIFCRIVILAIRYSTNSIYKSCSLIGFQYMDDEFCKQRAKAVRELAEKADPFIKKRLLELARHYERRVTGAKETEARPERQSEKPQR